MNCAKNRNIWSIGWLRGTGTAIILAGLVLLGAGCAKSGGPPQQPMATVTVMHPLQQNVTDWEIFPGRLQSPQTTSIQARVSGLITETPFKEGALVHEGDVLFVIDERPFKADLDNKKATVAKDVAQVDLMNAQLARSQRLLSTHVVDQQDFDVAQANYLQAQAQLAADQAAQEASELNMEWTHVRAPITGLVGKINVTVGNLITGGVGNGTSLTTLVSVDPIYCYVPVPESTLLRYEMYAWKQNHQTLRDIHLPASVQLEGETDFPFKGVIDFVDNSVDPDTGTIQMRGVFANPREYPAPGLFARMRIEGNDSYPALLVPDSAVGTLQDERLLMVVDSTGTVQTKRVQLGRLFGDMRVISGGITPEDRVIVNGLQMARPGTKVNVVEAPAPQGTPSAAASTGSGS